MKTWRGWGADLSSISGRLAWTGRSVFAWLKGRSAFACTFKKNQFLLWLKVWFCSSCTSLRKYIGSMLVVETRAVRVAVLPVFFQHYPELNVRNSHLQLQRGNGFFFTLPCTSVTYLHFRILFPWYIHLPSVSNVLPSVKNNVRRSFCRVCTWQADSNGPLFSVLRRAILICLESIIQIWEANANYIDLSS